MRPKDFPVPFYGVLFKIFSISPLSFGPRSKTPSHPLQKEGIPTAIYKYIAYMKYINSGNEKQLAPRVWQC